MLSVRKREKIISLRRQDAKEGGEEEALREQMPSYPSGVRRRVVARIDTAFRPCA